MAAAVLRDGSANQQPALFEDVDETRHPWPVAPRGATELGLAAPVPGPEGQEDRPLLRGERLSVRLELGEDLAAHRPVCLM
jgi:hypothetical protein